MNSLTKRASLSLFQWSEIPWLGAISRLKCNTLSSIKLPFDGHASRCLPGQCFRAGLGGCWKDGQKDGLLETGSSSRSAAPLLLFRVSRGSPGVLLPKPSGVILLIPVRHHRYAIKPPLGMWLILFAVPLPKSRPNISRRPSDRRRLGASVCQHIHRRFSHHHA